MLSWPFWLLVTVIFGSLYVLAMGCEGAARRLGLHSKPGGGPGKGPWIE